ncbi:MAG TPA: oligosaccharide flippase family protein, partial [Parafilimonas sp.]
MSFKKKFFRNVLIYGSYIFSTQFIIFLTSLVTSRLLLPADFGLVALITVFSNFISIFSDSGISYAVIRSGYSFTYYRGLNTISLLLGIILCIVFSALIYPIALFYKSTAIILPGVAIAFLFIARSLNIVPIAIMQKQLKFSASGKPVFIATIISACCTVIMALAGLSYWSLIWAQFINSFVTTILVYKKFPGKKLSFYKPVLIKSYRLTKSLIGNIIGFNTVSYWSKNSDNLIVGKFYGSSDLGIYNRAYLMLTLPLNLVSGLFSSVLYPSLVRHKNEGGDVETEYYFILKIIALLTFPVAIILILFPDLFVKILWGKNWMMVAKLLPYFGLMVMTQTINSTIGSLLIL